jgi:hypothetical protein
MKRHPLHDVFLRLKNAAPVLHREIEEHLRVEVDKHDKECIYAFPNDVLVAQGRAQWARWMLDCVVKCDPPPPQTPSTHQP